MADDFSPSAAELNADARSARLDRKALAAAISAQGPAFQESVSAGHDCLFADAPVFISIVQLRKMYEVIASVERVVQLPGWLAAPEPALSPTLSRERERSRAAPKACSSVTTFISTSRACT